MERKVFVWAAWAAIITVPVTIIGIIVAHSDEGITSPTMPTSTAVASPQTSNPGPTGSVTGSSSPAPTVVSDPSVPTKSPTKPPTRKVYYPKPNVSRYSSSEYLVVTKAVLDRGANLVTVYFESHGDQYPIFACIKHSDGNISIKDEHYEIDSDKFQKGSLEFQFQGRGTYRFNHSCDDESYTDVFLFRI